MENDKITIGYSLYKNIMYFLSLKTVFFETILVKKNGVKGRRERRKLTWLKRTLIGQI